jgi:exopolyphosphatase/pppGpp-phosphohydrolase
VTLQRIPRRTFDVVGLAGSLRGGSFKLVVRVHEKFDPNGRLTDEPTRRFLKAFLDRFVELLARFARD